MSVTLNAVDKLYDNENVTNRGAFTEIWMNNIHSTWDVTIVHENIFPKHLLCATPF